VSSREPIKILPNKKIKVSTATKLNNYQYKLSYAIEYQYDNYEISSIDHFKAQALITSRIVYELKIGVGTKLCNAYGQKGEVARLGDLSRYPAYKKDNTCVHPQLLMSAISVIGRTAAGQVQNMADTEDCAYTTSGGLVAPCDIWISSIHASTKIGCLTTRTDSLKMCNGFDGNKLAATNHLLSEQSSELSKLQNLHHALTINEHKGFKVIWSI
jgi:hypothetical protein